MITDKEYPATHLMSTSWYIVDDEGNVGIMDYNENGPVPWGVEQTSADELKYGHWEDWDDHEMMRFHLTDEQVLDLLHEPHDPSEESRWFDCAVKIDKEKTKRFLELCNHKDIDSDCLFCISEELGIYEFDAYNCAHDKEYNEVPIKGTLKTMVDENIIVSVYKIQSFDMNDEFHDGEVAHEKEFDNSPYYMFHQPYWSSFLPQKMNEPKHPVKIEQVPEEFVHRLHRIPGSFKEMDTFQIAEHYPCSAYSNEDPIYVIDGCSYQTSPLADGSKVYTMTDMNEFQFLPFCSEKDRFHCTEKCSTLCAKTECMLLTDKPTVLVIFGPKEGVDYIWECRTDVIFQKAYCTAYIPRFPYRTGQTHRCLKSDVEKFMTQEYLTHVFNGAKGYIEKIIKDTNPRVILFTDDAVDVFNNTYDIHDNVIKIDGKDYPFYKLSSLSKNRTAIENLAIQPYQGKEHPLVITLEEMNKLVKMGIAKEYKDIL